MFLLGLTGSIGMGKSTTAQMLVDEGCALWDADAAVHRLYGPNGAAVAPLAQAFPEAVDADGVSRARLKQIIASDAGALSRIERIVHPLVAADRQTFIAQAQADIVVLDIPLLFETGGETRVDAIACVFISDAEQERRVMARGTMTKEQFETIRAKQMPAQEKCARSDYVIETDTLEHARQQVQNMLADIRSRLPNA
ncbi:dephospho-CoA kinase [Sulfitobacter sp. S190]|uniref:dephospho-CoA kinase n=1 Tax=Sulfitobacter sp. S190 TaxID=2867022 RepID=UPI0021A93E16|nr:dephospho-CoA kinase [Sulfitobacter sp. S190]UWR22466.1 dephospho-CoA kinase [Sulfitobacter sp. S190]